MTRHEWLRVKALFDAAADLPHRERRAFLDSASLPEYLRREVESLLAHSDTPSVLLEPVPPLDMVESESTDAGAHDPLIGERLGAYRVERLIGRGGMGVVYLATRADDVYQGRVAIKIVKRGMDTEAIVRRFYHERQTLATLDHPNIARLLDGGTTDAGLPYFVMELVDGIPIHRYCDAHTLNTVDRLRLFRTVCEAVDYAHRHLVVHRDLKPDNILVTLEGVPKLLDFGIAKVLAPDAQSDATQILPSLGEPMTPGFASPEQLRGEPIGTPSDVYSLGLLLYELLCGHRPYRLEGVSFDEVVRRVCEVDPERPSLAVTREELVTSAGHTSRSVTPEAVSHARGEPIKALSRRLRGDLDAIVMKAIRKQPGLRYGTAAQLSDDVARHLDGRPVTAQRDGVAYLTRKFVRRHRGAVAATALLAASLVAGLVATTYQARRADEQRMRAERRFDDVRRLANSLIFELHDGIEKLPGSTPQRELIVARALEYLNSLAQEADDTADLQRELALGYQRIGDVQGNPYRANLGRPVDALRSYRIALGLFERLVERRPSDIEGRRGLAASHERIGDALALMSDVAGSLESQRKGLAIREALATVDPSVEAELATSYYKVGEALGWSGDNQGALESSRKSLTLRAVIAQAKPLDTDALLAVATSGVKVGELLVATGDYRTALTLYREAQTRAATVTERDPTHTRARRQLAITHTKTADALLASGNAAAAAREHRTALTIREHLLDADPSNTQAKREVAISCISVADTAAASGGADDIREHLDRSIRLFEELSNADRANAAARADLVIGYRMAGTILTASDSAAAIDRLGQANTLATELAARDAADMEIRKEQLVILRKLGDAQAAFATAAADLPGRVKAWREARRSYEQALERSQTLQQRGALTVADAGDEATRGALGRVEAALAKLRTPAGR